MTHDWLYQQYRRAYAALATAQHRLDVVKSAGWGIDAGAAVGAAQRGVQQATAHYGKVRGLYIAACRKAGMPVLDPAAPDTGGRDACVICGQAVADPNDLACEKCRGASPLDPDWEAAVAAACKRMRH